MQSSPVSCYFLTLRSKYSPQQPVLKHPQSVLHKVRDQVSHPHKTKGKIMDLYRGRQKTLNRMIARIPWV